MHVVHAILAAFDGPTKLAEETGIPMKTVFSWKEDKPNIPAWRRPAVLDAAKRASVTLPPEALIYLASAERIPAKAA